MQKWREATRNQGLAFRSGEKEMGDSSFQLIFINFNHLRQLVEEVLGDQWHPLSGRGTQGQDDGLVFFAGYFPKAIVPNGVVTNKNRQKKSA